MPCWWNGRRVRLRPGWPKGRGGSSPSWGTKFINCVMRFDGRLIPLTIETSGPKSGTQQCDASIHSNRQILAEYASLRKRSEDQPAATSRKVSEDSSRKWISQRRSNPYKSRFESDRVLQFYSGLFVQWIGCSATNRAMKVRVLHGLPIACWRNWQTQRIQNPPPERAYRFNSCVGDQV